MDKSTKSTSSTTTTPSASASGPSTLAATRTIDVRYGADMIVGDLPPGRKVNTNASVAAFRQFVKEGLAEQIGGEGWNLDWHTATPDAQLMVNIDGASPTESEDVNLAQTVKAVIRTVRTNQDYLVFDS